MLSRPALCVVLLLGASTASAISITPAPGSGLGPDDGTEIYCPCDQDPNPHITRDVVTVREGYDLISSRIPHEWGFYFADDPSTLYPIFRANETPVGNLNPRAAIDFDHGTVVDLDDFGIETTFTPRLAKFGFYIKLDHQGDPEILSYSQHDLNPGDADTYGSFPSLTQANFRVVAFEIEQRILSLETVNGACNVVPEPSVALLLGGGLAMLATRRRMTA